MSTAEGRYTEVSEGMRIPLSLSKPLLCGAVEVIRVAKPEVKDDGQERFMRFYGILRGLTVSKVSFGLRIERIKSTTKVYYTTYAKSESTLEHQLVVLEQTLKANLPDFRFTVKNRFNAPDIGTPSNITSGFLLGAPLSTESDGQRRDALAAVCEMIQSIDDIVFQVFVDPRESKDSEIHRVESEYSRALENAETTVTLPQSGLFSGKEQASRRKVNVRLVRKAEQLRKQLDRVRNRHLCDVCVTSICWGITKSAVRAEALRPLNILQGSMVPADEEEDFRVKASSSRKDFERLLGGLPAGKKTTLSIPEALTYLILPDSDLGIQVGERSEFHSNPQRLRPQDAISHESIPADGLTVGHILDDRDSPVEVLCLPWESLAMSVGVFGDIGSGKTTTLVTALHEISEHHVPFLAMCPTKNEEYRRYIRLHPDTRVFTPGDETTAPLRYNPHQSSEGVLVNSIVSNVMAAYIAAFPSLGMVKNYLEAAIQKTYERLGWDRDANTRGEPLLLSDFLETLPTLEVNEIDYSEDMNQDFRGALKGRFRSLQTGPLSRVFNTLTGMTVEELVSKPTIILMDGLSSEEKALLSAFLIINVAQYFESLKKRPSYRSGLKFMVVIEEAHNLLGGASRVQDMDEGHAAVQHAINTILTAMREGRSSGVGFVIIDQLPKELPDAAVAIPRTTIVHNMSSIRDREKVCDQINCSEAQKRKVGALPIGQAVVKLPDRAEPVRVNITPLYKEFPELHDVFVTNVDLKAHMERVYQKYPHFREGVSIAEIETGLDPRRCARVLRLVNNGLSRKAITAAIDKAKAGDFLLLSLTVSEFGKRGARDPGETPLYCQYFTWLLETAGALPSRESLEGLEEAVISQVQRRFGRDWAPLVASDEQLRTITARAISYLKTALNTDPKEVKSDVRDIFVTVIEERNRQMEEQSRDVKMTEKEEMEEDVTVDDALDPTVEVFVKQVVETDVFAKMYFERLLKAANGDLAPLVNMIAHFVRRTGVPDGLLQALARRYLEISRATLGAPEDVELWRLIVAEVDRALTT